MIHPRVRQIWSTFTATISVVKQFVLQRPNLNMIECAILSDKQSDMMLAFVVAISQCLIAFILAQHVYYPQSDDNGDSAQCDVQSIYYDVIRHNKWSDCISKCYWRVNFSFLMTIIAVIMSSIKVRKQVEDQYKFHVIFKQLINPSVLNIVLLLLDCFVNVILPPLLVVLTFFLISSSEKNNGLGAKLSGHHLHR
jgi:hypothetical protein